MRNEIRDCYVLDTFKEREERGPEKDKSQLSNWKRVYMEAFIESEGFNRADVMRINPFVKDLTNNQYPLVYIGETGDLSERFDSHHKMPCIRQNGATQIGVHRTNSKQAAQNIEEDVLGRYNPPCNG